MFDYQGIDYGSIIDLGIQWQLLKIIRWDNHLKNILK